MIAAIHVAVKRIEVERDDVAAADWHVENCRTAQKIFFAPGLAADDKWSARGVSPFEDDARAVFWTIEAGSAIGHAQPGAGCAVERIVLAEDMGVRRVTISNRMIRPSESDPHVCAGSARDGILRGCS